MTDNEIIKALECCADEYIHSCDYCPFEKECSGDNLNLVKFALDLINRQKAEIEKLDAENDCLVKKLDKQCDECVEFNTSQARKKAIKEFAERLKKKMVFETSYLLGIPYYRITEKRLNDLVKEMVGDADA